jgi:hypothetical protein
MLLLADVFSVGVVVDPTVQFYLFIRLGFTAKGFFFFVNMCVVPYVYSNLHMSCAAWTAYVMAQLTNPIVLSP